MKQKAFTLIEVLLTTSLVLMFSAACVFNFGTLLNSKVRLDEKVSNYITLSRYVKCNAELSGKRAKILVETNKLKVITEDFQGSVDNIPTLQPQLDDLNDQAYFESEDTNVVTYLPDGSVEKEGTVGIKVEDDENEEQKWVTIGDFNRIIVSSCHTNNCEAVDCEKF
jgi:prepilin-type N-terminal cleavage/methylation domain-containing protein